MAELILPGVYIEVRAEALIVPGPISVGNIGIVGTARKGPVGKMQILSSYAEAREIFGPYDQFDKPDNDKDPFTLVRALEIAYANGASTVLAVRVVGSGAAKAHSDALGGNSNIFSVEAKDEGAWGNNIKIKIEKADPATPDKFKVTLTLGTTSEEYIVERGNELVAALEGSALVKGKAEANAADKLVELAETAFKDGKDGAAAKDTNYKAGFDALLDENAHIMVAAGLDAKTIGDELLAHVNTASTDKIKRDRIAVLGSTARDTGKSISEFVASLKDHTRGERIIFVAPGIKTTDAAADPPKEVTLPGAYAAAAVAGMLSARDPHISLTNKQVAVGGLEVKFNSGHLETLLGDDHSVLALEERRGFRVVKGITTDTGAFRQITTRRIVDFAKFGVRSAADPYIGLLNNDRVRKALKGSINGFLASMVDDEMLVSYELDVTATRDEEIRGIAKVTMTLRPTFSIDYIKVVMFLG